MSGFFPPRFGYGMGPPRFASPFFGHQPMPYPPPVPPFPVFPNCPPPPLAGMPGASVVGGCNVLQFSGSSASNFGNQVASLVQTEAGVRSSSTSTSSNYSAIMSTPATVSKSTNISQPSRPHSTNVTVSLTTNIPQSSQKGTQGQSSETKSTRNYDRKDQESTSQFRGEKRKYHDTSSNSKSYSGIRNIDDVSTASKDSLNQSQSVDGLKRKIKPEEGESSKRQKVFTESAKEGTYSFFFGTVITLNIQAH